MTFKIVHTYAIPGVDHGESLVKSVDARLIKGIWRTEDELIGNTEDADAAGHLGSQGRAASLRIEPRDQASAAQEMGREA